MNTRQHRDSETVRTKVREGYGKIAVSGGSCCSSDLSSVSCCGSDAAASDKPPGIIRRGNMFY